MNSYDFSRHANERLRQLVAGHCTSGVTFHYDTLLETPFAALIQLHGVTAATSVTISLRLRRAA